MGCLFGGLAALLSLALPAAIARHSLAGACSLIVIFAALALAVVAWRTRGQTQTPIARRSPAAVLRIGAAALVYLVVVTVLHFTG